MDAGPGGLELRRHNFRYALYPHNGSWQEACSYRVAYDHNIPAICMPVQSGKGRLPNHLCGLKVKPSGVLCSAMNREPDGDITLRLYETEGRSCEVLLEFGIAIRGVWSTNLPGRGRRRLKVRDGTLRLRCGRFEIKTLRLEV